MSNLAWGGFSNGRIPGIQMSAVPNFSPLGGQNASAGAQSNMMRSDAARQLSGMMQEFFRARKKKLSLSEGFRSYDTQGWYYNRYIKKLPGWTLAAFPGTSIHGWGLSADLNVDGGNPSGDDLVWLRNNAAKYGFVNDVSTEPWHWSYRTDLVRASVVVPTLIANPQGAPSGGSPSDIEPPKIKNLEEDVPRLIRIYQPDNSAVHGAVAFLFPDRVHGVGADEAGKLARAWGLVAAGDAGRATGFAENISYAEYQAAVAEIDANRKALVQNVVSEVWAGRIQGQPAYNLLISAASAGGLSAADQKSLVEAIKSALPTSVGGSPLDVDALSQKLVKAVGDDFAKRLQS